MRQLSKSKSSYAPSCKPPGLTLIVHGWRKAPRSIASRSAMPTSHATARATAAWPLTTHWPSLLLEPLRRRHRQDRVVREEITVHQEVPEAAARTDREGPAQAAPISLTRQPPSSTPNKSGTTRG